MFTRLLSLAIAMILTGCSMLLPAANPKASKDKKLLVNFIHPGWNTTDPRESDHAWVQEKRGDVIVVNSFCGAFQALSLEALALKTFQGYQEFKPLGKHSLDWYGREAFEMEAEARVDGVKVLLHLRNYRRDHCYYDFVLISPRDQNHDSLLAFEALLKGVQFK